MTAVLIEWVNLDLRHRHWRRPCEREDGCLPAEERGLNRSPLKLSGGTSPADTLISSFQTPEWRDDKYLLLKPPHRGCSVTAARANEYLPRAIAESWGHISSRGYLGIRLLQADCHLPMQRNYGQSKQVGGAHIKLPGAVLEGQQAPEDVRSRLRSTQPQIPPSGPARTTLGAPNPFSCPLGEAGPLPGLGLSPTPERALFTLHPRTLLRAHTETPCSPHPVTLGTLGHWAHSSQPASGGVLSGKRGTGRVTGQVPRASGRWPERGRKGASARWPPTDPNGRGGHTQLQPPGGGHHAAKSLTFCQSLRKMQTFTKTPWCLQRTLGPGGTGPSAALCGPLLGAPVSKQQPHQAGEHPGSARS